MNTMIEETRYDLDDSGFRVLDLTSAMALITLAAKWQDRQRLAAIKSGRCGRTPTVPSSIDPLEWARYNEWVSRQPLESTER